MNPYRHLFLIAVLLFATSAGAQFMPLTAKMRQTVDTTNRQTGATTHLIAEGEYYRSSDGSRIMRWTTRNGSRAAGEAMRGSLWDNKTGTAYSLDFLNKRAVFRAAPGPTSPDTSTKGTERLPERTIDGVPCKLEPTEKVNPSKGPAGNGVVMGTTCFSTDYDLIVEQDITSPSQNGTTVVHSVFELYEIHIGQEPDANLFDVSKNFLVLKPQNQN